MGNDGRVDEWMKDGLTENCVNEELLGKWTDRWLDRWTDGWMKNVFILQKLKLFKDQGDSHKS